MRFFLLPWGSFLLPWGFFFCPSLFLFAVTGVGVTVLTSYLATIPLKRSQGGGVQIVRFAQCTPYTIILECHPYCKWGSVYNVHNRYWNIYLGAVFCGKVVSLYIFFMLITFLFLTEVPPQKSFEDWREGREGGMERRGGYNATLLSSY